MGALPVGLQARVPTMPESPLEMRKKAVELKSLIQAGQMDELKLKQAKQQMADQDALTKSLKEWDGKNWDELPLILKKNGGSGDSVLGLYKGIVPQKQSEQTLTKEAIANLQSQNDAILQAHQDIDKLWDTPGISPVQLEAAYQQSLANLAKVPGMDMSKFPPHLPDRKTFEVLGAGLQGTSSRLQALADMKRAEAEKLPTEASLAMAAAHGDKEAQAALDKLRGATTSTTDIKEYEYAKSQGYKGSFQQWQKQQANLRSQSSSTVVIHTVDENGNPITKIVPKQAGAEYAEKHTGQEASRAAAAVAMEPLINRATQMLQDPKLRAKLGPLPGRVSEIERRLGNLDPDVEELYGTLKSIYSLGGTMHGWRALQVANEFERAFGSLHTNPDATIAGLRAMMATAQSVAQVGGKTMGQPGATQSNAPRKNPFR